MGYRKTVDWYELWRTDKRFIVATMHKNIAADLMAGYNPCGELIRKQTDDITLYTLNLKRMEQELARMSTDERNIWCYRALVKSGVITA